MTSEERYAPEGTVPTPQQWINRWNDLDEAGQLLCAARVIASGDVAHTCLASGHDFLLEEVQSLGRALATARQDVLDELLARAEAEFEERHGPSKVHR